MKIKKSLLLSTLIGFVFASAPFSWAKHQVLQDLTYSQRLSTKLVDINYRLSLEAGQTAEVTFTFSHDNGSTFPVECRSVTGDVGKGMTSGNKSAVWDAGVDWPLKFTEQGRIKATCTITGEALPPLANPKPIPFEVVSVPLETSEIVNSPIHLLNYWIDDDLRKHEIISLRPKSYAVAKYEVTNSQWNEVVKWSVSRGYDLKQVSYKVGEGNLPRTNVAIKEVIKWLNALSEKHGLTPMYYLDPFEPRWDQNGDGKFTLGNDSMFGGEVEGDLDYQWDPDFDWSLIPNGKDNLTGGWIEFDPNFNGKWDEGEPFYDRNRNGIFDNGDSLFGGNEPGDHDYSWDSNFDWSLIPNGKMHLQGSSVQFDPNFNGVWDKGEPFYDRNRNGKFEPWEFFDFNKQDDEWKYAGSYPGNLCGWDYGSERFGGSSQTIVNEREDTSIVASFVHNFDNGIELNARAFAYNDKAYLRNYPRFYQRTQITLDPLRIMDLTSTSTNPANVNTSTQLGMSYFLRQFTPSNGFNSEARSDIEEDVRDIFIGLNGFLSNGFEWEFGINRTTYDYLNTEQTFTTDLYDYMNGVGAKDANGNLLTGTYRNWQYNGD
ncbi:MAG: hypothetical protein EBR72_08210, partial [Bacteroidetes bacterium]|nr:hypothetical protein [Bacteroidota bacterium]